MYAGSEYATKEYASNPGLSALSASVADVVKVIDTVSFSITALIKNVVVVVDTFRASITTTFRDIALVIDTFSGGVGAAITVADVIRVVDTFYASISFRVAETVVVITAVKNSITAYLRDTITVIDTANIVLKKAIAFIAKIVNSPQMKGLIKPFSTRSKVEDFQDRSKITDNF